MSTVGVIVVAILAVCLGCVAMSIDDWSRDLSTNYAEVRADAADEELRSPTYPQPTNVVAERIEHWVSTQPRWTLESKSVDGGDVTMHLVRKTRLMRFADDIHVHLQPVDGKTLLTAESQSRVGKGDLGQNPRNLKELLGGLRSVG